MIMNLPEKYHFKTRDDNGYEVYVKNSVLMVRNISYFRKSIFDMTYMLKGGKHHCSYCGKDVQYNKITLDHMYPQDTGGPTITNNLIPACMQCNSEKSNMTVEEYKQFLEIKSISVKDSREYLKSLQKQKELLRKLKKYQIPDEWLLQKELSRIIVQVSFEDAPQFSKYRKVKEFYEQYGYFKKPILVDRNGVLIDGFYNLIYAKANKITYVPTIQIENVEITNL